MNIITISAAGLLAASFVAALIGFLVWTERRSPKQPDSWDFALRDYDWHGDA